MKQIIEDLNFVLKNDLDLHNEVEQSLKTAPEGSLEFQTVKGKKRFFNWSDNKKEYIAISNESFPLLSNKRFYTHIKRNVSKKVKILKRCIQDLKFYCKLKTPAMIYEEMPKEIKATIKFPKNSDERYAQDWQAKKFETKEPDSGNIFKTLRGDLVRSKTELIIADKLYAAGIPYHYEVALDINYLHTFYPDFYILNKRTHKIYIWEHFGKMDDPTYCRKTLLKLETYQRIGYKLGKNLIATFESSLYQIKTETIDTIISSYLK